MDMIKIFLGHHYINELYPVGGMLDVAASRSKNTDFLKIQEDLLKP